MAKLLVDGGDAVMILLGVEKKRVIYPACGIVVRQVLIFAIGE